MYLFLSFWLPLLHFLSYFVCCGILHCLPMLKTEIMNAKKFCRLQEHTVELLIPIQQGCLCVIYQTAGTNIFNTLKIFCFILTHVPVENFSCWYKTIFNPYKSAPVFWQKYFHLDSTDLLACLPACCAHLYKYFKHHNLQIFFSRSEWLFKP